MPTDQEPQRQHFGRLLVVDDDRAIVDMVVDYFTELGLDVVAAYDGAEALRLVQHTTLTSSFSTSQCRIGVA